MASTDNIDDHHSAGSFPADPMHQFEISRYFERLPKSTTVASEELVNDELFFRNTEEEEENLNLD